jgi:hypothetical protein
VTQNNQANSYFKVSPLNALMKVLTRNQGTDHYSITGPKRDLAGSATIQRFPKFQLNGQWAIPVLMHSHAYPLGKGGQFSGFTSTAYWFDFVTGALLGSCNYSDNRTGVAMNKGMGPWDWVTSNGPELELPVESVIMNFAATDTYYKSAWAECKPAMGSFGPGIGHGNAYLQGSVYELPDTVVTRQLSIESNSMPGIVGYRYTTKVKIGEEETIDSICFWVNAAQEYIQFVTCNLAVVEVADDRNHSWIQRETRWVKLD